MNHNKDSVEVMKSSVAYRVLFASEKSSTAILLKEDYIKEDYITFS